MAEKKSNGFRTFLLILTTIILTGLFGFAAYLILVPESSLFGLRYLSNSQIHVIDKFEQDKLVKFADFGKIIVNVEGGKGHTHVQINHDNPNGIVNSQIRLLEDTKGFTRVESASDDYSISVQRSGAVLTINITEPEYNFLQLVNNTVLQLNVHDHDSISGANIEIRTGSGNVTLGGKSTSTGVALKTDTGRIDVKTTSGSVLLTENLEVTVGATIVSESGAINIQGAVDDHLGDSNKDNNRIIPTMNLESKTGKIQVADINSDVNIKSFNSNITFGSVVGNVDIDMESGILNFKNISGNLISENHLLYTTVNAEKVFGDITLVNDDGNFSVNIQEAQGDVAIRSGSKTIKLGLVYGNCTVETINGAIDVTKHTNNSNDLVLKSTGGAVYLSSAKIENGTKTIKGAKLLGDNQITTSSGGITLKFSSEASFQLKAQSEKGKVFRDWAVTDQNQNPVDSAVGSTENSGNLVALKTINGYVHIERVA